MNDVFRVINDGLKLAFITIALCIVALIYGLFMFSEIALHVFLSGANLQNLMIFTTVMVVVIFSGLLGIPIRRIYEKSKDSAKAIIDPVEPPSRGSNGGLAEQGG